MTSWKSARGFPGGARTVSLGLLVSAQFVVMLDTSIVNVALPSIQADLALGAADATWIVNAYVVAFGGLLLLSGRLADLFGRRRMFTAGSALFAAGTLLAAAAPDQGLLLAGRVVQGVGAAALSPAAMSLLLLGFPGRARARAMSIWGAASTLGGATGVVLGGLLAGSLGWRSVFLVTVPVSVAAVVLARRVASRECSRSSAPLRLAWFGGHHRSGRRPGARRRVRCGAGMDGSACRREHGRRRGADGGLRDGRASGR
jgi:MFS family permease